MTLTLNGMNTLTERDKKVIWHPFTQQKNMQPPIAITSGKGALLVDEDGHEYIDAISSWWVNIHGHAHPYIAEKIFEQAKKLEHIIFAGFTHEPAIELAERLLNILPGNFDKIFYSDNGSTSTEVALKMCLQYWWNKGEKKRTKILAFNDAYHGDTFGAMSVSDRSVFTLAFHDKLFEVLFIDTPTYSNLDQILNTITTSSESIAAFIYEPLVQGAGGMKMYDADLLNTLLQTCKKENIPCIADEVMTGFGRTGKLFASEYCRIKPDIICLSKGLTGGTMALGVTACSQFIYEAFVQEDKLKTFFHGHSFTANPIACTAAIASLELWDKENTLNKVQTLSQAIGNFLKQLKEKKAGLPIKNPRQLGTILALEITQGKDEYLNNISTQLTQQALDSGVYLRPLGNTLYLMPPYCISAEQLQKIFQTVFDLLLTS